MRRRVALVALLSWAVSALGDVVAFARASVVLLQPDEVFRQRIGDSDRLAAYIEALDGAANAALSGVFQKKPNGGFVVIALKPPRQVKVWVDMDGPFPESTKAALGAAIRAVEAPEVTGGVVVFALKASFWGGKPPTRVAPSPEEWKAEAARLGTRLEVGELVDRLWND